MFLSDKTQISAHIAFAATAFVFPEIPQLKFTPQLRIFLPVQKAMDKQESNSKENLDELLMMKNYSWSVGAKGLIVQCQK